jgi:hypothetical protein
LKAAIASSRDGDGVALSVTSLRRMAAVMLRKVSNTLYGPRCEDGPSSLFPVTGMMKKLGLSTGDFQGSTLGTGVRVEKTWDYRVARGRLIALEVHTPEGARPWFSSEVMRVSPAGVVLEGAGGWTVHMEASIEPGGRGEVVLAAPEVESDAPVRLEVREKGGSRVIRMKELR